MHPLKGKKILVTAGPTWVALDDVRVISNVSSGELGMLLAKQAAACGARVDFFLGPVSRPWSGDRKIKIVRFAYFHELLRLVKRALKSKRYDVIIHSAAVSDYWTKPRQGKISSDSTELVLKLKRAPKIVDIMRDLNPEAFLVMFKLEGGVSDVVLLKRALEAMKRAGADLVVANRFVGKKYRGFILGARDVLAKTVSKKALAQKLFSVLKERVR
jgi:phosphopantothenoylcysteine decarboxylase/phosphopantothenate--cysteine ligase